MTTDEPSGPVGADNDAWKADMAEIRYLLPQILQRLRRIDRRIEEQGALLKTLIPVRIGAIPANARLLRE